MFYKYLDFKNLKYVSVQPLSAKLSYSFLTCGGKGREIIHTFMCSQCVFNNKKHNQQCATDTRVDLDFKRDGHLHDTARVEPAREGSFMFRYGDSWNILHAPPTPVQ